MREFGMALEERVASLLLQSANLAAVRAVEYDRPIQPYLQVMEETVVAVNGFVADHELPEYVRDAVMDRVRETTKHIDELSHRSVRLPTRRD
jgi:hypothetical protein